MSRLVSGIQSVREALRAHGPNIERILTLDRNEEASATLAALVRFATDRGVTVEFAPRARLDSISKGARHQGAIAFVPDLQLLTIETLLEAKPSFVTALDRIVDPQNFGALMRSSVGFGADAILWAEHSSAPLTPATFRASAGAVEHAKLCRARSLTDALQDLRNDGMTLVGLAGEGQVLLDSLDLTQRVVIVVGSEESGLRKPVRSLCHAIAKLPTLPPISALNASVAAGIAAYEVRRQRLAAASHAPQT
jgi:23S rRNA (guanosine2251-2'-O)-methyltransferase